jgi:anti-anti-sigma factor
MDDGTAPAQPSIEVEPLADEVAVVTLRGEHDLSTTLQLSAALEAACARPRVLVDLSQCAFIDSTVLALLLSAHSELVERDGRLELFLPSDPASNVHRLLKLSMIDTLLHLHESRSAALASIQSEA